MINMKNFFTLTLCFLTLSITAQDAAGYWIGIHHYASHTEGELAGMTTWRLYLHMLHPDDFLSACTGSEDNPWIMESTSSPAWYQHSEASETLANAINPEDFIDFPELEYDSWLTLGVVDYLENIQIITNADPTYDAFAAFEAGDNVVSNTPVGNLWAHLFPGLGVDHPGFAGDDLKVLIAQLTTSGTISGSIYVQIFPFGIQDPDLRLQLPFILVESEIPGCTDQSACNFNAESIIDDGSCVGFNICGGCENEELFCLGCTDIAACNYDDTSTYDDGTCEYPEEFYNCDGICIDPNACNYLEATIIDDDILILYEENFESYNVGDYIGEVSSIWTTWSGATGGNEDGQISDEQAYSGTQSLKVYGSASGGPMDLYFPIGLETPYDVSFKLYIPSGYSAYMNIQEQLTPAVAWAFDLVFSANGAITLGIDQVAVAYGNYNSDSWNSIHFFMSPENDIAEIIINGETLAIIPFDDIIGGLNLFGYGDGITEGLYYIDDVIVSDTLFFTDLETDNCEYLSCSGCTTSIACNYNPEASIDDDSCIFICTGCTDDLACNYDTYFLQDDGSCIYPGCIDMIACNYDANAGCDDDNCQYFDECGECGGIGTSGCSEPSACNYDITADCDDMSCVFHGCMDDGACNFDANAGCDDGTCDYETCAGCMYEFACNYDHEATISDNESCEYGTCPGCTDPTACNYNPTVSEDDGWCEYCSCNDCSDGCTNIEACNYDSNAISDDGSCLEYDECGVCGGSGIAENDCDCEGNQLDAIGVCGGDCEDDYNSNGVCDDQEVYGCTYIDSPSFDASATVDDGSCVYDIIDNFCPADLNYNGTVGTPDLLLFLSAFGNVCG
jgi:hypothetical protein